MRNRLITWIFLLAGACSATTLQLASVFSDHMVLQREQPVPVWGQTDPGATVTVTFANQKKTSEADASGKWRVNLDPMPAASNPQTLWVSSNLKSKIENFQCSDVLVGDVWLCSGQSNMEWPMSRTENGRADVSVANHPLIRLYKTPKVLSATPNTTIDASWEVCTKKTISTFSGVAYFFGKRIHQELEVPVGLLQSAWGGTRIEPWTPPAGFEGSDTFAYIRERINPMPVLDGDPKNDRQFPTALYNGMIHAHIPFAIRGAIWYQGEANHRDGMLYVKKTAALLKGWRELWGYDFPYYFVQITPYQYGEEDPSLLAEFWEAQAQIVTAIPKTGMAVVNDKTTLHNIHPPNKETPGTRLALLALDNTYGLDLVSTGPIFQTLEKGNNSLTVVFDSAEGLTTRDGKDPDWFEVAGEEGLFKPAQALIDGHSVILSSPEVLNPIAMRFAWHKLATPNLMNGAGLPTAAFRAEKTP